MIGTLLILLACWVGFSVVLMLAAAVFTLAERRLHRDPLERIWGLPASERDEQVSSSALRRQERTAGAELYGGKRAIDVSQRRPPC